ncbi:hypothetical protein D0T92_10210 [Neisseria zalophi]|uniref:Uncharacterized protein n=1 Tax=Neisseria zalophi TaxID=640030 RepID=A0A5J6PX51_9NEIS|nr:hypothetical protein D0T92_10210 [Neisseria zalophi]
MLSAYLRGDSSIIFTNKTIYLLKISPNNTSLLSLSTILKNQSKYMVVRILCNKNRFGIHADSKRIFCLNYTNIINIKLIISQAR